jgi:tryptophan-rich sensory protein
MFETLKDRATELVKPEPRYRWWHAAGFGLAANAVYGLLVGRRNEEPAYEGRKQAPFAPPTWVFTPAWAINNVSILWGDLALMNEPEDAPERDTLIALQAAWWGIYSTFGYVYLKKNSPILAAAWTASMLGVTVATTALSLKTGRTRLAQAQVSSLAWLTLATAVAVYQARYNADPMFGYEPPAQLELHPAGDRAA